MRLRAFLAVLIPLGIIIIDQIIKIAIKTQFLLGESYEIASWFQLRFTENRGMAFGMDFIGTGILTVFRLCAVAFFIYVLSKEVKKRAPIGFIVCLAMIIAGAFGNIVDNAFLWFDFYRKRAILCSLFWNIASSFCTYGPGLWHLPTRTRGGYVLFPPISVA